MLHKSPGLLNSYIFLLFEDWKKPYVAFFGYFRGVENFKGKMILSNWTLFFLEKYGYPFILTYIVIIADKSNFCFFEKKRSMK